MKVLRSVGTTGYKIPENSTFINLLTRNASFCGVRGGLQFAGSSPCGVIGIFRWIYPWGLTITLGSTQLLTEMSTGETSWG